MTSRQTGQQIHELSRQRRRTGARRGKRQAPMTPAEKRRFLQLAVCCGAFVLLVGVKLLLPEQAERLRASVSGVLERNMDVAEVFSAVGKAVAGEKTVGETLGDVYQAVFRPVEPVKTGYADAAAVEAIEPLRAFADGEGSATAWLPAEKAAASAAEDSSPDTMDAAEEPEQAMELSAVLYSGENLPANVSMEQMVLGFDYCTPVQGTVSSNFGYRSHPIEGEEKFHYGLDIAADSGTEIDCFADGVVTAVGDSTSYGKYCIVSHEGGYSTLYAHCSRVTATSGASVTEGQKIAEVGETGMATGPHLHFELQENETYLNPVYYVSLA